MPFSTVTGTSRQKINKEIEKLNTINQEEITDIYKTLHPPGAKHTLFSNTHGTFSRTDHVKQQIILNKFKQTEICMYFL